MKKLLAILLVITLALSLLTACGGGGSSSSGNTGSSSSSSSSSSNTPSSSTPSVSDSGGSSSSSSASSSTPSGTPATPYVPVEREVEVPASPLDITDESIWYVVLDGVKFNLYDVKVKDFINAGFPLAYSRYENTKVDAHSDLSNTPLTKKGTSDQFDIYPINLTGSSIPIEECEIRAIDLGQMTGILNETDVYIVCNLAIGCTEEEVISVFGDGYDENQYEMWGQLSYGNQTNSQTMAHEKLISFILNNDGIVTQISFWMDKNNP